MHVIRDDLSDKLIHLTRGPSYAAASETLSAILEQRALVGGTGCIRGGYRCVCFSEAPLAKLGYLLANPSAHGVRYMPYGIMLSKEWLFARGGRPAIYQADAEFPQLPEQMRYRHVRYEPPSVDFSWEREWRFLGNSLELDPATITVIVPNRDWVDRMKQAHTARVQRQSWAEIPLTRDVAYFPWHFVALEDLGVPIPVQDEASDSAGGRSDA